MLGRDAVDVPLGHRKIAGIEHLGQQYCHALRVDFALSILRKEGLALQVASQLSLSLEAAGCKALQSLPDDAGERLVWNHHLTVVAVYAGKAVTGWRPEHPIAVGGARLHTVLGLLGVLLALVLRDGGEQVFYEDAVRIVAKLQRGRFKLASGERNGLAQLVMDHNVTSEARDIVDDDHMRSAPAVRTEKLEHLHHAGAVVPLPGKVIAKDLCDLITSHVRVLAAASFLRGQAVPLALLSWARYAAIDDGFGGNVAHGRD